jgi:hypothetical protein
LSRTRDIPAKVAAPAKVPAKSTCHHCSDIQCLQRVWFRGKRESSRFEIVQYRVEVG